MALSINLYHEVLRAKKRQQYDPLKLSMLGMIVIAIGLAGYYALQLSKKNSAVAAASAAQAEYAQLLPKSTIAKAREDELLKDIGVAEALSKRIEERFYWAPVLERVALVVPKNVQLSKFSGDVKTADGVHCALTIDGSAAGAEPRKVAEELRTAIGEKLGSGFDNVSAVFKSLEDSNGRVLLDGNQFATVAFSIAVSFDLKSADPKEGNASAPNRRIAQKN